MKKNLILISILGVLVLFSWAWNGPIKKWEISRGTEKNFLSGLSLILADKIEIEKSGVLSVLEKSGDRWKVSGTKDFYVSASDIEELSTVLEKAANGRLELVSSNKNKKESFGLNNSLKVKIVQNSEEYEFLIGKATDDFTGTYVALNNLDKSYRVNGNLATVFARNDWRDHQIFSFSKSSANKVRFQYGKAQFIAEKNNNAWSGTSPKKFTVSELKINEVLLVLENLSAADIPAQDFSKTGLDKNNLIIQVTGDGLDNTLMVGNCNSDKLCYAKKADSDNIYLITQDQKNNLTKKMTDLK